MNHLNFYSQKNSKEEILDQILQFQELYQNKWRTNDYNFWINRLLEEVTEASGVVNGTHQDNLEHELYQIASICINFLIKINEEK